MEEELSRSALSLTNAKKQGFLTIYRGVRRNPKKRWFILQGEYLYFFNDDGSKKPKGVFSLVDYSKVVNGDHETKIWQFKVKGEAKSILLAAGSEKERDEWVSVLDSSLKATNDAKVKYGFSSERVEFSCYCKVFEAKLADKEVEYDSFCTILADQIQKGRTTTVFSSCSPAFDQEYEFEIENPSAQFIIVQLKDQKKKKDNVIGQIAVPLKDLEDQKIHEAWFKMTPGKTTVNPTGTLKFQYNYSKNRVKFENFKADGLTPMDTAGLADPFLVINFGNKKEKTVTQKRTLSPQWPKSISFEIPADSKGTFYIEIYSDNRDGTSDFMGEVRLPVAEIKEGNDEVTMEVKKKEQLPTVGEMRVALHARKSVILKESDYTSLFELLMKDNMELTKKLVAVSNKKEKPIAECLVKAFEMRRLAVHFIKTITSIEIEKTSEPNIIFRENTVATKSLDMYMRLIGMQYLHSIMKNIVAQLVLNEKKKSCELDEFRIEDKQERKQKIIAKNLTTLMSFVSLIFEDMQKKIDYCPTNLRNIFEHIQGLIKQKWPDHPTAQYTAVSGFIFLRFFCPSLYSPKLYDLTTSHPPPNVARELTLIAKTLQNLASLVVFGKKEPFMHIVNPFITEQMPNMKTYLTELSSIPEKAVDELPTKTDIHWGREMSRVHFHLEDNLEAMKAQFGLTQDLEKLTEILKDLKKKEMEYKESRLKIPAPLHEVAPMAGDEEDSTFYKGSLSSDGPDFSASISTGPKNDKRGGLASSKTITNTNSTPKKPSSLMSSIDQKPERPSSPLQITEPCPGCSKRFSEAETSVLLELSTNTFWHTDCLKCSNCHKHITQYALKKPLLCLACAEVDSKCARCKEVFKAGESVLRVDLKAFHRHCLNCSLCAAPMDPKTANGYFSGVSTPDLLYICSSCTPEKEKDKGDWVFLSTKVT